MSLVSQLNLYHLTLLIKGAYLADVLSKDENDFIKSVLNVINPKDGTDYWLGGLDADKNKGMQWISGKRTARVRVVVREGSPYSANLYWSASAS